MPPAHTHAGSNEMFPFGVCRREAFARFPLFLTLAVAVAGCVGIRTPGEKTARRDLAGVATHFRPADRKPTLPTLTTNSPLGDFLSYAVLNQPQVEAAYFDW